MPTATAKDESTDKSDLTYILFCSPFVGLGAMIGMGIGSSVYRIVREKLKGA